MIKSDWILQRIKLSSNKTALIDVHHGDSWTYRTLERKIFKWVRMLQKAALDKGDRVAVLSNNQIELFPIIFACGLLELVYVPFNWRLSKTELQQLITDSGASLLIYESSFTDLVASFEQISTVAMENIKDAESVDNVVNFNKTSSNSPWLMIYTGGTTGKPKGVVISHEAVNTNALNTITSWSLGETDCTINYMPLFHTGGINALSLPLLMAGGTVVIGHKFEADEALQATNLYQATISLFVPTMYQTMIQTEYFQKGAFPSMRVFLSGGAPCPVMIYEAFHKKGIAFKEGYGLTEAGPNNFFICPEVARRKVGSIGKNMLFNEVKIVKTDGTLCEIGEVGELYLKGKHLFTSYWNNEQETRRVFIDGWFKTGDLAKFDEDGDYYIVGRKKDMMITGGENVYPQEVEQCLLQHEWIAEAAVIGVPDEKWGEKVVAFLVLQEKTKYDEVALKAYCKTNLGNYKVPKQFNVLEELPKTDVGKIDKHQLQKSLTLQ